MKLQDVGFFILFAIVLAFRRPIWFAYAGLLCVALAIPLFSVWVFFTGERLVWYGAALIVASIIGSVNRTKEKNI